MLDSFIIINKTKSKITSFSNRDDFELKPDGQVDKSVIINNPNITPYALDIDRKEVVFVENSIKDNLLEHPFFYQAQYLYAQRVITISFRDFNELSESLPSPEASLIFLYSIGRCGSTLMSKVFNEIGNTISISEADTFTQLVSEIDHKTLNSIETKDLIESLMKVLYKPSFIKDADYLFLKFRSFCTEIAGDINSVFPKSKNIFMYRDLSPWIKSCAKAYDIFNEKSIVWMRQNDGSLNTYVPLISLDKKAPPHLDPIKVLSYMWLSGIDKCLQLINSGMDITPLKYEDLISNPAGELIRLFQNIGIDEGLARKGVPSFDFDSQEGSLLSRKNLGYSEKRGLSVEEINMAHETINQHKIIMTNDFRIPNLNK